MYVVLQGIESPSCMIIVYEISFRDQQSWTSEVRKLERFNKTKRSPDMINFFLYCIEKMNFSSSPKGYPPRTVSENYEKKLVCNENYWN